MWVLFSSFCMLSNLYWSCLHDITCVALGNLQCNIGKNRIENEISLYLDMVQWSEVQVCWFLNWIHRSSQLCAPLSVEWFINPMIQSNKHVSWRCLFFDPHVTTHQSICRCLIKKSHQVIPAFLIVCCGQLQATHLWSKIYSSPCKIPKHPSVGSSVL